jgi:NAD(P)-dependent dehydrogenase (short-subunit alcohol dehydrogenase family)
MKRSDDRSGDRFDDRFDGRVAIVTGGALGIGGAVARRLAEEGARVLIADIADDAAAANVATIEKAGGKAIAIHADMNSGEDVRRTIEAAVSGFGRLDFLIQNAWGAPTEKVSGSAIDLSEAGWDEGMRVMTKALFLGAKYGVPEIVRTGGGAIVNIASVHGLLMAPNKLVYEAAKSAVIGMTRQMAIDFSPMGVRVNAICPGHIVTERAARRWAQIPDAVAFLENQYPVRRLGDPADVAAAVAFLCSDDASFITGHPLVVDGGLSIQLQEDLGIQQAQYVLNNPDAKLPR